MLKKLPKVILASSSPRRVDLMREAKISFRVKVPKVSELKSGETKMLPRSLSLHNASLKALAVSKRFKKDWVIGADTIVVLGRSVFGKPEDFEEAIAMLGRLCGRTHVVLTGVCICKNGRKARSFIVSTEVSFKKLSRAEIVRYLKLINPLDKAGSYAAQEYCDMIIRKVSGSFSNVVGLPMEKLRRVLLSLS